MLIPVTISVAAVSIARIEKGLVVVARSAETIGGNTACADSRGVITAGRSTIIAGGTTGKSKSEYDSIRGLRVLG